MTNKFLKVVTVALSIALLAPFATKTYAETTNEPQIIGASSVVMDIETGEVIYSKNADEKHALASTTKLLTALLFAENTEKTASIPYTENAANLTETSLNNFIGKVNVGNTMSAEEVMNSLLIYSANDAAVVIADYVGGSVDKFADMMNTRATEIGALNTKFVNPHGLELSSDSYNYTTAYDLALISKAAFNNNWIRETLLTEKATVSLQGKTIEISQRNKLLGQFGNIGGKTGTESLAGHCFVGFFDRDNRKLLSVVLGSEYGMDGSNVFNDTKKAVDYSYGAKKNIFIKSGSEVDKLNLKYKVFGFIGPEKSIEVPMKITENVSYYPNTFNESNAKVKFLGTLPNAWDMTSDSNTSLTLSIKDYKEDVSATASVNTIDLLKANWLLYATTLIITIIIIFLVVMIIKLIASGRRQSRRGRYYR